MKKVIITSICLIVFLVGTSIGLSEEEPTAEEVLISYLQEEARSLEAIEDLSSLINEAGGKRLVLLGEASHGTSEYYEWRKKISRNLIEEKDFSFIAVEGDWPRCFPVNQYVKGQTDAEDAGELLIESFQRWPEWMWANEDVLALIEWLRAYNQELPAEERVGFYGMDMQSFEESIQEVKGYLGSFEDEEILALKEKYRVFEEYDYDNMLYARATFFEGVNYQSEVQDMVEALHKHSDELKEKGEEEYFNALQNARVVKSAEKHGRYSVLGGPEGWNIRVQHMEDTVYHLLERYGAESQGIVWAHNTHVGDARFTEMKDQGQINIGQLTREELGEENVFIVGFSTYEGTVMAGREWGATREIMEVPSAKEGSIDNILAGVDRDSYWLLFDEEARQKEELIERYGQRAIGVAYVPEREHLGNYVATILPQRYDALLFFRETQSVTPLD